MKVKINKRKGNDEFINVKRYCAECVLHVKQTPPRQLNTAPKSDRDERIKDTNRNFLFPINLEIIN